MSHLYFLYRSNKEIITWTRKHSTDNGTYTAQCNSIINPRKSPLNPFKLLCLSLSLSPCLPLSPSLSLSPPHPPSPHVSFLPQYVEVGWPHPHPWPRVWAGCPSQTCPAECLMTGCLWNSCVLFVRGSPPLLLLTVSSLWTWRALLCFTRLVGASVGPRRACTYFCLFWEHLLTVPTHCKIHLFPWLFVNFCGRAEVSMSGSYLISFVQPSPDKNDPLTHLYVE